MRDSVVTERRFGGYVKGSDRCVADVSDFRNDVRITLRTRDMAVRLVVVDEAAVLGVPLQTTVEFVTNREQLAKSRRLSTVEEILERTNAVADAEREVVRDIRRAAGITANVDRLERVQLRLLMAIFAFRADNRNVVRTVPRVIHLDAILEDGANVFGTVVTARKDLDRFLVVDSKRVKRAAELMSAPVGEESVAVFRERAPTAAVVARAAFAVEGRVGSLTLPTIPVESLRNRLFREIAVLWRIAKTAVNFLDFANGAALNNRRHVAVVFHNALAAARADAVVFARRLDDEARFLKRQRQRLFAVDVFARLARLDGNLRVPMVGARADDRVDVVALKNVLIMRVFRRVIDVITLVDAVGGSIKMIFIAVADAQRTELRIAEEPAEEFVAAVAETDVEELDYVAWRDAAVKSKDAT